MIRPGGMGDCILAIPAMQALQADFTEVWTPSAVVPLIQFADRVRAIPDTGIDLLGLPSVDPPPLLIESLRTFDSIVSWYGTNRPQFRTAVQDLALPFQFLQALPDPAGRMHCCDFFLHQVGAPAGGRPRIDYNGVTREKFAVIHPFSGSRTKNWPLARFHELAARLPAPTRWCAGPEEQLENATRISDLYQLGRWLARAHVYIGNDSGITHLAAASSVPVIVIFGPTDPAIWAPRGDCVRILRDELDKLTVQEVFEAAIPILAST